MTQGEPIMTTTASDPTTPRCDKESNGHDIVQNTVSDMTQTDSNKAMIDSDKISVASNSTVYRSAETNFKRSGSTRASRRSKEKAIQVENHEYLQGELGPNIISGGKHEIQENADSSEMGGPLATVWGCSKNQNHPGHHEKFIPVSEFSVDHVQDLPSGATLAGISKDDVVALVKSYSPLVMRINVKLVSINRPDRWDDQSPYPFANLRGNRVNNAGSGWVSFVNGPYQCAHPLACGRNKEERSSDVKCWRIELHTARDLVFNDVEARSSEFIFFDEKPFGSGTFTITGGKVQGNDTTGDYCRVILHTHDNVFGEKLNDIWWNQRQEVRDSLDAKLENCGVEDLRNLPVCVISHPHGKLKYCSVGTGDFQSKGEREYTIVYNTPTCPGSTGGLVIDLGGICWDVDKQRWKRRAYKRRTCGCRSHSGATGRDGNMFGFSCDRWSLF